MLDLVPAGKQGAYHSAGAVRGRFDTQLRTKRLNGPPSLAGVDAAIALAL